MMRMISIRRPASILGAALGGLLLATLAATAAPAGSDIPDRPEKLTYPPLKYEAPDATKYRVKLANGMAAYLVPDRTFPLVTVTVMMRVGPDLDPVGREGLASTAMYLLTRSGTATMTAEALESRVAFLGAQLESGLGGGGGMFGLGGVPLSNSEARASVNLLSKDLDEGLTLLTDCLKNCAFQADRLKLRVDQQMQDIDKRNDESGDIEEYEWNYLLRGENHWTTHYATEASMSSITRDDLAAFTKRWVGPKNFVLAVSGDFDRNAMVAKLNKAFAAWPTPGENPGPPAGPTTPVTPGWYIADKDVNQTRVSFGLRTIDRYDPDYYAASVMNYIMGGGSFTSRLVNRIRSDEGLAYSVNSRFEGGWYYPDSWRVVFQTKARSTAFAMQIAMEEIRKVRSAPVTDTELMTAKNALIEGFPARFPTMGSVAGALAADELTGRWQKDPTWFGQYAARIGQVTVADVQRVAQRLLDPDKMVVLMVGSAKETTQSDGKHDVTLATLAGGDPKKLPLRDPKTMKPLP